MANKLKDYQGKTAIILCGGKGTRLGSIGKKIPKTLVKIQGTEILRFILSSLVKYNFKKIILPIGYKGEMIERFIKKYFKNKKFIKIIKTGTNTNIGKRIFHSLDEISTKEVLLLNGDAIFDFNINNIYKSHYRSKSDVSFLSGEISYPFGTVGVLKNKVVDFKRNLNYHALKIRNNLNYIGYNYSGIILIKTKILKKYKNKFRKYENFESKFYPILIKRFKTQLIQLKSFWHSIDNVKDIMAVNDKRIDLKKYKCVKNIKNKI